MNYVVQVLCTGMGWVDTKYSAFTREGAERAMRELLADDKAWLPGRYQRQVRIRDNQHRVILESQKEFIA